MTQGVCHCLFVKSPLAANAIRVLGVPFPAPNGEGMESHIPFEALIFYRRFGPIAVPGNSIFVYDLTLEEVNRVRRESGVGPWREAGARQ